MVSLCPVLLRAGYSMGLAVEAPTEELFVKLLNTELEKFNDFFMEKEEEFVIRMQVVREQIERLVSTALRCPALLASCALRCTPQHVVSVLNVRKEGLSQAVLVDSLNALLSLCSPVLQKSKCQDGDLAHCNSCVGEVNEVRKVIVGLHGEMVRQGRLPQLCAQREEIERRSCHTLLLLCAAVLVKDMEREAGAGKEGGGGEGGREEGGGGAQAGGGGGGRVMTRGEGDAQECLFAHGTVLLTVQRSLPRVLLGPCVRDSLAATPSSLLSIPQVLLENYSNLNYTGLVKILKKPEQAHGPPPAPPVHKQRPQTGGSLLVCPRHPAALCC